MSRRPRGRRQVAVVGVAAAALLLSGCSGSGGPSAQPSVSTSPRVSGIAADPSVLPACPATRRVAPRADGLPALTLPCLGAGPAVRLSDLRGTPTILNVWAGWCPPCAAEIPRFKALHDKVGDKVRFFGVHYKMPRAGGLAAAKDFGVFYPSVQDTDGDQVTKALRVAGPPQTFFVTADGRVVHRELGEIRTDAELDALVQRYLGVRA